MDQIDSNVYIVLTFYRQKQALKTLVKSMCENYAAEQLCNYPFIGLEEDIDEALEQKCHHMEDVKSTQPYHKILYAWRIKRGNYRGGMSFPSPAPALFFPSSFLLYVSNFAPVKKTQKRTFPGKSFKIYKMVQFSLLFVSTLANVY